MARRILAAWLVGLLLLSGCGGSGEEDPPKTASPSPTPTKSMPVAPELPEAAKANTKEGATAFVRHYVELINLAAQGHVEPILEVSESECDSCHRIVGRTREIYDSGGRIEGGIWEIKHFVVAGKLPETDRWSVRVQIKYGPQKVIEGNPPKTTQFDGGEAAYNFVLHQVRGEWKIVKWSRPA